MPDEPDRYDLDEMMDRLKQRSTGEPGQVGEVVTREDGSQAIKVRRRKRRSHQPHKERQRRMRILQVSGALVLLLLIVLAIGFITIYVNTAPFRQQVTEKLNVTSGAEVKLQQFRMNPTGVNVHGIDFEWPEGNVLDTLTVRLISADVWPVAVFTGRLSGQELTARTAKLTLSQPDSSAPTRVVPDLVGEAPVYFRQCNVADFQIQVDGERPGAMRLTGSEATYMPAHEEKAALLRMSNGDLRVMGWPLLRLDRAYIELGDDQADVVGLSLKHADDDTGLLELSGLLNPYGDEEANTLAVKASAFQFSGLIGDELGRIFDGWVDSAPDLGDCDLSLGFDEGFEAKLNMAYRANADESFAVQNLPFLYGISQILGDEWFSRPDFWDVATGKLMNDGSRVVLSDIQFSRRDRMAIRGQLEHKGGALSGRLELGVSFGLIQAAENKALEAMFSKPREGFRWVTLEISGTTADPIDNFSKRYEEALADLGGEGLEKPGAEPSAPTGSSFEELTRPR